MTTAAKTHDYTPDIQELVESLTLVQRIMILDLMRSKDKPLASEGEPAEWTIGNFFERAIEIDLESNKGERIDKLKRLYQLN